MMPNALPNEVLGVAYLINGLSFLRQYRNGGGGLPWPDALRCVAAGLVFCALEHAAEALAFFLPGRPVFRGVALLAAVVALAAVSGPPRCVRGVLARCGAGWWVDPSRIGPVDGAAVCREVRITLGRLPSAVQEQVRAVHFGGAREAAALVRQEAGEGLQRMGLDLGDGTVPTEAPPSAQEAAALHLARAAVPFEFIVPQPHQWEVWLRRFNTPRGRKIAAAALAVIFLPLFAFFIRGQQESHLAAEWNAMSANVADLDGLNQNIRRFRPWFDRTPAAVQLLESLFAAFPEAGDVWAKSIVIKGATVTCTGFARDQVSLLGLRDRLRLRPDVNDLHTLQVRGENPVQFVISYHWGASHDK